VSVLFKKKRPVTNRINYVTFLLHINSGYSKTHSSGNKEYPHQNFTILEKYIFRNCSHKLKEFLGYGKINQSLQLFITYFIIFVLAFKIVYYCIYYAFINFIGYSKTENISTPRQVSVSGASG
jgi:hypothetical protein